MLSCDEPPIEHFDYDQTEATCRCRLCDGYRQAKLKYEAARLERSKHHRMCQCEICTGHHASHLAFLAASNQREVYSEMSFVLAYGPTPHRLAGQCLHWLYGKMLDPDYGNLWWWAMYSSRRALRTWIEDFEKDWSKPLMAVSGVV